ncbi:hypothetical protein Fmac_015213 [Flemingia macrophylla]|uniref:Uncharacterized protein n=1 Tax=Flemingia macrophylla TaxID=520843 RepID=A0ABD1MDX7_9FABA
MDDAKEMKTPMHPSSALTLDEDSPNVNQTQYRAMIGSLLYFTASRPDIMFSVCVCARYQAAPKESHMTAVKKILKYLKGTINCGLWYPKGTTSNLIGFSDADYVGCKLDRKSTSGTCHILGECLVSWHSKKQACVALLTVKQST